MKKNQIGSSLVALAIVLSACSGAKSPLASVPLGRENRKVVFLSFDGAGTDDVHQFLRNGTLGSDGYAALEREGTYAERLVPVTPSSTAAAHISMATGAVPQKTGVVGNHMKLPSSPINVDTSGFSAPIDVETIWEAARRQGKKVGVLTYPGVDFTSPRRSADWGMVYSGTVRPSKMIVLHRSDFQGEWYPPGWNPPSTEADTYSPILRARLRWELTVDGKDAGKEVELRALDTTNDGVTNYDRLDVVEGGRLVPVDVRGWFATSTRVTRADGDYLYGSWSRITDFDRDLTNATVYWGGVNRTIAYPAEYRKMLDETVGFWPGEPDDRSARAWMRDRSGIDPDTFAEQNDRFSRFFTDATLLSMKKMRYDLLIGYQPAIDSVEHQFRIVNERQKWSTPEMRVIAARVRVAAYGDFDQAVTKIRSALPPNAALVVAGDHGLAACDTAVGIGTLLEQWGFAKSGGKSFTEDSRWAIFSSGNVASFYRARGVGDSEVAQLQEKLKSLKAPDGSPIVEKIVRRTAKSHPNSGDLTAYAYPRFVWTDKPGAPVMEQSESFGQHGGLGEHPEFHTIFAAAGPGIPHRDLGVVSQTSVARFLARLLGIDPPSAAE